MPKWRVWPSPPQSAHIFALDLVVCDLTGLPVDGVEDVRGSSALVQVQWSGGGRGSLVARRAVERNCTARQRVRSDGTVSWWEGFRRDCKMKMPDPGSFKSWIVDLEIHVFGAISSGTSPILGKTQLDISKFVSLGKERSVTIPVKCSIGGYSAKAELKVTLKFSDPRTKKGTVQTITRALSLRASSCTALPQTDRGQVWRSGTRAESGGAGVDFRSSANGSSRLSAADWMSEEETEFSGNVEYGGDGGLGKRRQEIHHFPRTSSLRRLLSWNRGKLGFKSAEQSEDRPVLYKASGVGGGDDGEGHQRAAQSRGGSSLPSPRAQDHRVPAGFEDDGHLDVGSWEERTIASRDGRLEVVTEVFLASIDQRSEQAAGESACSVLAAVIADWLHRNPGALPPRFRFDELVREGSAEWRRLCADESRMEKFSDRHFDLDTVLGAKVRPLTMVTGSSYVGFFGLESVPEGFEYLQGAMSFDDVWEELLCARPGEERVYIAGWNDHFFLLKVEEEAVYLIDTLGERLFEGCNQAYILKFDKESKVYSVDQAESATPRGEQQEQEQEKCFTSGNPHQYDEEGRRGEDGSSTGRRMVCQGLASGKEFIKGFLAALPLRELQVEMEKGLAGKAHLHRLLQIEFHYTSPL